MKIRKLQRKFCDAVVSVWPLQWASSYKPGNKFAIGEEGFLESVRPRESPVPHDEVRRA